MITRWALAPLIAGRMAGLAGRMAGHHPLNRRAVTGGALRRFLVGIRDQKSISTGLLITSFHRAFFS